MAARAKATIMLTKQYQEHLEAMMKERTSELRRANRELTEQIQHRIRVARHIEDSRDYLGAIIGGSHDGIGLLDEQGCFEFGNDAFFATLGWPRGELIGQPLAKVVPPDLQTFITERWQDVQRGPGLSYDLDTLAKNRERHSLLVSLQRITIGDHTKYCMVTKDITSRKRSEVEMSRAIEQLKAHDKAKTQFVSNVSHELKTPLSSMTYAIDNILRGIVGDVPERLRVYIDMLREDAERLGRVIGDILDMSRLESNMLTLERVTLPFGPLVRHVVSGFRIQAEKRRLSLCVAIDGNGNFVNCDPQKIERVIMNVIHNAVKFTPEEGAIEISLTRHPDHPDSLLLTVTDSGIGIPAEHLTHVTERYFRIGEYVDGTGLGLAIAKEIVVLHGGELLLQSPPPGRMCGTQVRITLPLASPPTIIAVDDDQNILDLLGIQLGDAGYRVVTCTSPTAALACLSDVSPGLILTDIVMPDMDGIKVIATIRTSQQWRRTPVGAITGAVLDRAQREILEGLNIPTLHKPWRLEALLTFVEDALTGNRNLMQ
jgi:PAS domain S-box-containing protein